MFPFDRISDESNREAGEVIRSVAGTGPRPDVEVMPGFESMVAGAALALERGQPHAIFRGRDSTAENYLKEGSHEWRTFHDAVARVIHLHRAPGSTLDASPEAVMTHIATDVVNQGSAKWIDMAVKDNHPAFEQGLSEHELRRLDRARNSTMHAKDIRNESYGNYSELSTAGKHNLIDTFEEGRGLSQGTRHQINDLSGLIRDAIDRQASDEKAVNRAIADFRDFGQPLFPDVSPGGADRSAWNQARDRMERIVEGDAPRDAAEAGVATHVAVAGARDGDHITAESRTHALVRSAAGDRAARVATSIEAEVLTVRDARHRQFPMHEEDQGTPTPVHIDAIAYRDYHMMAPDAQADLHRGIAAGDRVPGLTMLRIMDTARIVEHDMDYRREQAVNAPARQVPERTGHAARTAQTQSMEM